MYTLLGFVNLLGGAAFLAMNGLIARSILMGEVHLSPWDPADLVAIPLAAVVAAISVVVAPVGLLSSGMLALALATRSEKADPGDAIATNVGVLRLPIYVPIIQSRWTMAWTNVGAVVASPGWRGSLGAYAIGLAAALAFPGSAAVPHLIPAGIAVALCVVFALGGIGLLLWTGMRRFRAHPLPTEDPVTENKSTSLTE
jgi:hypothetical protein